MLCPLAQRYYHIITDPEVVQQAQTRTTTRRARHNDRRCKCSTRGPWRPSAFGLELAQLDAANLQASSIMSSR